MKQFISLVLTILLSAKLHANPNEFSIANSLNATTKKSESSFDRTRLIIGPGLGLTAGQRAFAFNINPSLGYAITDNFSVGASVGFSYFQQAVDKYNSVTKSTETFKYKLPTYSMSLFARYMIANMFILGVEPEISNTKFYTDLTKFNTTTGKFSPTSRRLTIPSFLIGAGYGQRMGEIGYYYFMGMYDLVQNPNARYYYQTIAVKAGLMIPLFNN
jgi:hypothetical protein